MLQLHLSNQQVYCLLRCGAYQTFDGIYGYITFNYIVEEMWQQKSREAIYSSNIPWNELSVLAVNSGKKSTLCTGSTFCGCLFTSCLFRVDSLGIVWLTHCLFSVLHLFPSLYITITCDETSGIPIVTFEILSDICNQFRENWGYTTVKTVNEVIYLSYFHIEEVWTFLWNWNLFHIS